jgi:hypothetical protein
MGHHVNWDAYIAEMAREGISPYDASQLDGAQRAANLDKQLDAHETANKRTWAPHMTKFETTDQLRAAMADEAYKVNPHYRARVAELLRNSEPSIGQVKSPTHDMDNSPINTPGSMLQAARKEAAISQYKLLVTQAAKDPVKRLELLEILHSDDPSVIAWRNEGTEAVAPEGPGQKMFREARHGSFGPDLNKAMSQDSDQTDAEKGVS